MARHNPIVGPFPQSTDWHEARHRLLTATDTPAILGCVKDRDALSVWAVKTGRMQPFKGNEYTRRGQRFEAAIAGEYEEATGHRLSGPMSLYIHPELSYLGATPDYQRTETPWGVECKWTTSPDRIRELGEQHTDCVPDDWMLQVQHQIEVMGWDGADLACMAYGKLRTFSIPRNDRLIDVILKACAEMKQRIDNDDAPEPTWESPHTVDVLKEIHDTKEGVTVLSGEATVWWQEYQRLGDEAKDCETRRKAMLARVLDAIGDHAIASLPGGTREVAIHHVADSVWTAEEIEKLQPGAVKRRGHVRVQERKARRGK